MRRAREQHDGPAARALLVPSGEGLDLVNNPPGVTEWQTRLEPTPHHHGPAGTTSRTS